MFEVLAFGYDEVKTIDHVATNYPQRITHTGIIPCATVCDRDGIFSFVNVRVTRFKLRCK